MRPRAWADPEGCSSTIVLYDPRNAQEPNPSGANVVFVHTNLGWVNPDVSQFESPLQACEDIAKSWGLEEVSEERARWLAGMEGEDGGPED
jgi:hypothetical protein